MQLKKLENKNILNNFISSTRQADFLQSWEWGEFQVRAGHKVFRIVIEEGEDIIAAATLIKKPLFFGKYYFYCPRGPIFESKVESRKSKVNYFIFDEIEKLAKIENSLFLRIEPGSRLTTNDSRLVKTIDVQPSKTLILDLTKSEEDLLAGMHQKTRYNIRLAEKKGVKIYEAGVEKFADFWQLMTITCDRDKYRLHSRDYYMQMLYEKKLIKLYLAEYKNKPIAAVLASFFSNTVAYMHGASANEERNVMAPYLLQWEIIKKAKQAGYKYYDFYGVDEKKWPGVTRFKKGFGGEEINYPGTYDLVFNRAWYIIYSWLRKVRRIV